VPVISAVAVAALAVGGLLLVERLLSRSDSMVAVRAAVAVALRAVAVRRSLVPQTQPRRAALAALEVAQQLLGRLRRVRTSLAHFRLVVVEEAAATMQEVVALLALRVARLVPRQATVPTRLRTSAAAVAALTARPPLAPSTLVVSAVQVSSS
jgi:hypothetical protein